jgi:phage tail sheath protein FI
MANYKTPGVFVEEISNLPPSVAGVATAIPAFIGYTDTGPAGGESPIVKRITTLLEFITEFGTASPAKFSVSQSNASLSVERDKTKSNFSLFYAINHYFKNGGGPCYVVSIGNYEAMPSKDKFIEGVSALEKEDEPTLIVLTDAACLLGASDYYTVCTQAMAQCKKLGDRFTILDVVDGSSDSLRNAVSTNLDYGAAYTPYLQTSINYSYSEDEISVTGSNGSPKTWSYSQSDLLVTYDGDSSEPAVKIVASGESIVFEVDSNNKLTIKGTSEKKATDVVNAWEALTDTSVKESGYSITASGAGATTVQHTDGSFEKLASGTMSSLKGKNTGLYNQIKKVLGEQRVILPPSAAVAGIYARVDREVGVWKAPANVGIMSVIGPVEKITDEQQEGLNVDPTAGKSINAIRAFTGKGTLVWGARTLAGNDNEWRYVPVRRLFITVEESVKKASAFAVFEPNTQSTWLKVKSMIESYLYGLWQQGALAGADSSAAYYVNVGLGTTMTPQDVLEGRMIVEIGLAAVRPAEFIVLRFSHKLQTS